MMGLLSSPLLLVIALVFGGVQTWRLNIAQNEIRIRKHLAQIAKWAQEAT